MTELIEKEDTEDRHIFESIAQIMLSYAKFGEIKYGEEPLSEERIQVVFSLINDIDAALMSRSGIHKALGMNDGYYESYWESVSEVAHTVVNAYIDQNTHIGAESSEKKNEEV